jgi:hypothetical protein
MPRPVLTFSEASLEFTLIALDNTKIALKTAGKAAVNAAGETLLQHAKKAVGLRDHTLTELADMDHPYAKRHGSIRIHLDAPWKVHRAPTGGLSGAAKSARAKRIKGHQVQTDRLYNATLGRSITLPSGNPSYEVYFDTSKAPHAREVVGGNKLMLPRDPLWVTANLPEVRKEMMTAIVRRLGRDLRSKVGVRFGSGTPTVTKNQPYSGGAAPGLPTGGGSAAAPRRGGGSLGVT